MSVISLEPHPWSTSDRFQKMTVPEYILDRAATHARDGKRVLSVNAVTGEEILFSELDQLTANIASWFHSQGMKKGDTVLFMARNSGKIPIFLTGIWRANGVAQATYEKEDAEIILERVNASSVKWIYCDENNVEKCRSIAASCSWEITIITDGNVPGCECFDTILNTPGEAPKLEITPEDPAIILLSSGSTGTPKGALRTHKALLCLIMSGEIFGWIGSVLLATTPLHISGCILPLMYIGMGESTIVLVKLEVLTILQAIDKYKPTTVFLLLPFWNDVIAHPDRNKYDLTSINCAVTGGALITPKFYKKLEPLAKHIIIIYGSMESVFWLSRVKRVGNEVVPVCERKAFEVGKVMPGGAFQIRDVETGKVLGANQTGEVFSKCISNLKEYFKDPVNTAGKIDDQGWFRHGDFGSYDDEGVLSIFGRAADVFHYKSNVISPEEIEDIINDYDGVQESVVIGVPGGGKSCDDKIPRAFVVVKPGFSVKRDELATFVNEKLPDHKHLRGGVYFLNALPRGNSGKISRLIVSKMAASGMRSASG